MSDEPVTYDPLEPRRPKGKAAAGDEPTISIGLPDGTMTPPASLSDFKKAVSIVKGESGERKAESARKTNVAGEQLRAFCERIELLEEEKKSIADDIKDVYGEAKGMGFETKVLRKVIAIRKQDPAERAEQRAILDMYLEALGMIDDV